MAIVGVAQKVSLGKRCKTKVYVQFKNGSVYRFKGKLTKKKALSLLTKVQEFPECNLKYWETKWWA